MVINIVGNGAGKMANGAVQQFAKRMARQWAGNAYPPCQADSRPLTSEADKD